MGINLEDLLKELDSFQENIIYFLQCVGKTEDQEKWDNEMLILRNKLLESYVGEK